MQQASVIDQPAIVGAHPHAPRNAHADRADSRRMPCGVVVARIERGRQRANEAFERAPLLFQQIDILKRQAGVIGHRREKI